MGSLIYALFGIIEAIVILRFILRLLGANPDSPFVAFMYSISSPLVAPFAGIFGQPFSVPAGAVVQSVFDWSALVALIVYGLIAGVLARLFVGRRRRDL